MNFQRYLVPIGAVGLTAWAWQTWQWMGIALVVTCGVMWLLLYFNRLVQIMKRATNRPIGFVDSAVMLNAKLKVGMSLMHVIAMTRALGQLETEKDTRPEVFSWRDGSQSVVRCVFVQGKLQSWTLNRPFQATDVEPVIYSAND
ncbi:glycerate kinase [Limnohabitans sp.]|uniref:glycerate kinase n=1 Tax=Limnohabitans sp. TaxID=1907725 RepID=UPI00286F6DEC|nr:glycerate kinase [Limnohabitans sp.]